MYVIFKNQPYFVSKADFMSPGKGSAIMRVRFKNVRTGAVQDFTYKTNEQVEVAEVTKQEMQFLYLDGAEVVFMDPRSYEQVSLPGKFFAGKTGFLTGEAKYIILWHEEEPIGVIFPKNVILKVTEAQDAVAGGRVNAPKKPVVLETGVSILAPLFVKAGDRVVIDTETGEYLARAN
jgi:elongation factor P